MNTTPGKRRPCRYIVAQRRHPWSVPQGRQHTDLGDSGIDIAHEVIEAAPVQSATTFAVAVSAEAYSMGGEAVLGKEW
jgi:hypothetical protein